MCAELLLSSVLWGQASYQLLISANLVDNSFLQVDSSQFRTLFDQGYLLTAEGVALHPISVSRAMLVKIYLASEDAANTECFSDETVVEAYSIPFTVPETGQLAVWGDMENELFEIAPGTYQITAEARYLERDELSAYPELRGFLARAWDASLRDHAPEQWRLIFVPTNEPTEARELY